MLEDTSGPDEQGPDDESGGGVADKVRRENFVQGAACISHTTGKGKDSGRPRCLVNRL